jgi:hypothetical protein
VSPLEAFDWPRGLKPYAVARRELAERGRHAVLSIDPTRTASVSFLRSLERLDGLIYSPSGMATPRWALYDCAELPGVVYGLCASADRLPERACAALAVSAQDGDIPLNAVVAIPTVEADHWLVYVVCGLAEIVPTGLPDLRAQTLRAALEWLGAREVSAVCHWAGDRIALHLERATLEVRAAWMPAHDRPATGCFHYSLEANEVCDFAEPVWIASGDESALRETQSKLEAGRRFFVVDARGDGDAREFAFCEEGRA